MATIGDNTNVLLNPDPGSGEGSKGHPRKFAVTLHNFSSQFRNIAKEHLFH